jgi:charged multivesicular body protein 4A/B
MNLFGKKKQPPQPARATPLEAINNLRDNLLTLEKREEHINKKIELSVVEARQKMGKNDKNGALFALKRKKMFEAEVSKLQGARITLEAQILALESATVNIQTFQAMKGGANTMKDLRGNIEADTVDEIMDDIQEEKDIHDAISDAISRPGKDMFNDEELLDELAELDALTAEEALQPAAVHTTASTAGPQNVFSFPTAPTSLPPQPTAVGESEDERALRELEASMLS